MSSDIAGVDGVRLFTHAWPAQAPQAALLICHGIGEHGGRYDAMARWFAERGVSVCAYDQRGHGRSGGRRGHVRRFTDFLDDLERFVEETRRHMPDRVPLCLVGHSLGGLIALHAVARRPALADRLVLSSPACGLAAPVPAWKHWLGVAAGAAWPTLSLQRARPDGQWLSHDPAIGAAYIADPLVHWWISARCYTEVRAAMRDAPAAARRLQLPTLIFQAGDDHLVDPQATRRVAEASAGADRRLVWLDGWYHEVFNETQREQVWQQLLAWLVSRQRPSV